MSCQLGQKQHGSQGGGGREGWALASLLDLPLHLPSFSALHHAALNGNTELISLLLEAQAAVDIKDNKGKPGLGGLEAKGRGRGQGWNLGSLQPKVSAWMKIEP